eukprot:TRINITY_DN2834_c0_g1_i6.p1 TRINITY_DN2834_c0_g1~~TRINITY_DN2834_c0_g1_i6.p1  ORF type:complete len:389 (+),score=49.02 TRINITY_DN2834_c0_g1_i6:123-1289(+)
MANTWTGVARGLVNTVFAVFFLSNLADASRLDADDSTQITSVETPSIHTDEFRARNAFKIACPVLGALYRRRILNPDATGRITKTDLKKSLEWMGNSNEGALFQSTGIAAYREDDPEETQRARSPFQERYLNIFRMNPGDLVSSVQVQHGVSTNIRDTRFDGPFSLAATKILPSLSSSITPHPASVHILVNATVEEAARIRTLREERLNYWFVQTQGVLEDNKLYAAGLGKLIAKLKTNGDHSSEWSKENQQTYHPGAARTLEAEEGEAEWQSSLAFTAFMAMSGRQDTEGGPLYVTLEDLKHFYLDSQFPFDPPKRDFGFMAVDLQLVAELHKESPSLTFSKMVDEDVNPGSHWYTSGVKKLTLWMAGLFHKIGADDQFATISDMLW